MKINNIITNESQLDEISLGNYRNKASISRGQSQMGAMFGKPEEKAKHLATFNKRDAGIARADARIKKQREADQAKQLADLVARLPELKAEYEAMRAEYKSLGGSDWQYADREQNLTDRERKARSMEGPMNNLWRQIQAAEKAQGQQGVAEGSGNIGQQIKALYQQIADQGDDAIEFMYYDSPIFAQYWDEYEGDLDSIIAEVDPTELQVILDELTSAAEDQGIAEAHQEKIGGRYEPDEFDAMVNRLKKLAGSGPMKTVYDPNTRRYKNMPTAVQPGDKK